MFKLSLVDLEYETSVSIWKFEMLIEMKWLFCLHFSMLHDEIYKTQMKLILFMYSDTLICLWILLFPISIIEFSTSRKSCFWLYFNSLHDYGTPSTCHFLVHSSWCKKERCEKRAFQLLKMQKKKIRWNIKTKCVTDFLLTIRSSRMKDYTIYYVVSTWKTTSTLISIKNMKNWKFFVYN